MHVHMYWRIFMPAVKVIQLSLIWHLPTQWTRRIENYLSISYLISLLSDPVLYRMDYITISTVNLKDKVRKDPMFQKAYT